MKSRRPLLHETWRMAAAANRAGSIEHHDGACRREALSIMVQATTASA
jgi:hypothetical protein